MTTHCAPSAQTALAQPSSAPAVSSGTGRRPTHWVSASTYPARCFSYPPPHTHPHHHLCLHCMRRPAFICLLNSGQAVFSQLKHTSLSLCIKGRSQSQQKTRRALLRLLQGGLATLACLPHCSQVQLTAAGEGAAQNENDHLQPPLQPIASVDYKGPIFHTYSQMHSGKKL